jgi:hypothetical protein
MVGCDGDSTERREPAPSGDIRDCVIALLPGALARRGCSGGHRLGLEPRGDSGEQACIHSAQVMPPMLWGRFGAVSAALLFQGRTGSGGRRNVVLALNDQKIRDERLAEVAL